MLSVLPSRECPALVPEHYAYPTAGEVSVEQLVTTGFDTDAHYVTHRAYMDQWLPPHRLGKAVGYTLVSWGMHIANTALVQDFDKCPGVDPTSLQSAIEGVGLGRPLVYATRNGAHVLWELPNPIPSYLYDDLARMVGEQLAPVVEQMQEHWPGSFVDAKCWRWWGIFRCPYATRDGEPQNYPIAPGSQPLDWALFDPQFDEKWIKPPAASLSYENEDAAEDAKALLPYCVEQLGMMGDNEGVRIVMGESPIGESGQRNNNLMALCGRLSLILQHEPLADPSVIVELLRPSLEITEPDDSGIPWDQQALRLAEHAWAAQQPEAAATAPSTWGDLFERTEKPPAPQGLLRQAVPSPWTPPNEVTPLLIDRNGTLCYVFDYRTGRYVSVRHQTYPAIKQLISDMGLEIGRTDAEGQYRSYTINELLGLYARYVDISFDGTIGVPEYNGNQPNEVLVEPVFSAKLPIHAVRQDLPPAEFHYEIDEWLRDIGGDDYDLLMNWIATYPQKVPLSALVIYGPRDAGKSLIAEILAYFHGGSCRLGVLDKDFNSQLMDTPLVHAAETLTFDKNRTRMSVRIRQIVDTSPERDIELKGQDVKSVRMYPRLISTSNDDFVATTLVNDVTADGAEASAERLLRIEIPKKCRDYFKIRYPHGYTHDQWLGGPLMAVAHFRWIMEHMELPDVPKGRFGPLQQTDAMDLLARLTRVRHLIAALAFVAENAGGLMPSNGNNVASYEIGQREGQVWVSPGALFTGLQMTQRLFNQKVNNRDTRPSAALLNDDYHNEQPPNTTGPKGVKRRWYCFPLEKVIELGRRAEIDTDALEGLEQF